MAKSVKVSRTKKFTNAIKSFYERYCSVTFFKTLPFDVNYLLPVAVILVLVEICVSILVVRNVKYTEIDWLAYMQEVEGVMNGTFDYSQLKGDTGPLVYPAGFVYVYSLLYLVTDRGSDIRLAQYIFVGLYILLLILVFRIYVKSRKCPPYMLVFMCCTSYRIHSIFMLRLFNDPVALILLYVSINFFLDGCWTLGSVFFSLGVSVKMNVLLFAPALLLAYLTSLGISKTVFQLSVCAAVQLVLGAPFLLANPRSYVKGSFDLGRVFLHEWTVNWRFISPEVFSDRLFHVALLVIHIGVLGLFFKKSRTYLEAYSRLKALEEQVQKELKKRTETVDMGASSQLFVYPMFLANFIGVACSRSLHYQFYVWYYHSLPYLIFCTNLPVKLRLLILGFIEFSWNTFPSTYFSSLLLQASHVVVLISLYRNQFKVTQRTLNKTD